TLPFGGEDIIYYRTVDDYHRLRKMTETGQKFAVIGGGFIGSEIAAALAMNGKEVVMLFPEKSIGERAYPHDLSSFLSDYYREKKVEVFAGESVEDVKPNAKQFTLKTTSGRELTVDGIIAGIGIKPNVELAQAAKLNVENGILVDEALRTSQTNIY